MKKSTSKPNIVLIQLDQLTAKALPMYGNKVVISQNMEKIANDGVVFENAYCNFPLCAPSRMSMLTGRYATSIGVWDNATEALSSTPTLMHYLRGLGYQTTLCGKMHFIGPDQLHGYEERITTDIYPSNYAWTPTWDFGDRPTGTNLSAVTKAGIVYRSLQIDYDNEVEYFGVQKIYDFARYEKRPFFLTISFTQPHLPYLVRQEFWDLYDHEKIDMPTVPPLAEKDMDEMSRWIYYAHGCNLDKPRKEEIRNARHAYYGMISCIDRKIGNIIEALNECNLSKNTIIIITSDHGDMLGERGQWYKQLFYEWCSRIPLIIHCPEKFKPGRISKNISLVDLVPTLLDIATGGNPPEAVRDFDGHSLYPFLTGEYNTEWENVVISEFTGEGACAPCRMLRKDNLKYIYTHGHPDILYDLSNDPNEMVNIADDKNYTSYLNELKKRCLTDWNPEDLSKTIRISQRERMFIKNATNSEPTWAYKIFENDERRYVRKAGAPQTKARAQLPPMQGDDVFK